jgi:alanyl-tRNA synthetase
MEHKLYYKNPYLQNFTTSVHRQETGADGRPYVVLKETAFYPTGGGQPCDTGTIQGIQVTGVEEVEGEIRHYLAAPLPSTEGNVTGIIDWHRRFDHMQQHTGQHILSAAFEQLFDAATIGFHMGQETVTIDLATPDVSQEQADKAEDLANQIVFENRTITARFVDSEELATLPLRKSPSVSENIRIVTIDNFDYSPCGGTHPARTGEVGPIKILGWERYKGNVRLQFICGMRTIQTLREKHAILRELSRQLSSAESDIPAHVERLLSGQKEMERQLREASEKLLEHESAELIKHAQMQDGIHLVSAAFSGRTLQDLQRIARLITEQEENALALLVTTDGERIQFVCARGEQLGIPMNQLAKAALPFIGGKGGGNPKLAQGGGAAEHTADAVLAHLVELTEQMIRELNHKI